MAFESTCTECRRVVGVVQAPVMEGRRRYKLAVHASTPDDGRVKTGRARCLGTGLEVSRLELTETNESAEDRRRRVRREARAARAAGAQGALR